MPPSGDANAMAVDAISGLTHRPDGRNLRSIRYDVHFQFSIVGFTDFPDTRNDD